jgi:hypothetical protein
MATDESNLVHGAHGKDHPPPRPHEITITINNQPFSTAARELTGLALKQLANIPLDYELFRVQGDTTVAVSNEETVHLHDKEEFRAIPSGTFGS